MIVHLIDGTYELFRHFYGLRRFNKGKDAPFGAVRGVLGTVLQLIESGGTHVGVATDHVIESFRNDLWPGYKTSAGIEPALLAQFHPLEGALAAMGVAVWPMIELEADDALASAAHLASGHEAVEKVCIWTPDKDLAQCVRADRVVQVDLYKAEDESPRSITLALGPGAEDPIVVMPTTVQLVFGFGNICGDLGVLERRLAYRVVAYNRSPNERALNALENGVPLYEFDETLDEQGNTVERVGQREAYERASLKLSGKLRDLLDEGLVVGETNRGVPVRAYVGHILDGLLGSAKHPVSGEKLKISELYKELLFDEYEERGIPPSTTAPTRPRRWLGAGSSSTTPSRPTASSRPNTTTSTTGRRGA
jgi:hypothetical protein